VRDALHDAGAGVEHDDARPTWEARRAP
jgi:hypothetical protein